MKKHDKKKRARLVKAWQLSGERKSDFAARHGIHRSTFYFWTKHLDATKNTDNNAKGFEPIHLETPSTPLPNMPTAIIHYSSGTILELYTPLEVRHLKSLIT